MKRERRVAVAVTLLRGTTLFVSGMAVGVVLGHWLGGC